MLNYVKRIIALRKENPALRRGDFRRLWSANGTYAFSRSLDGNTFVIALNTSETSQQIEVNYEADKIPRLVFGEASEISVSGNRLKAKIPARCSVMLN